MRLKGYGLPPENEESVEKVSQPNLLDVIKINGRWAQVILGGDNIRYLDDYSIEVINWEKYQLVINWKGLAVISVKESCHFSEVELQRIHWGSEQKQHPRLKENVAVFGEFEKR